MSRVRVCGSRLFKRYLLDGSAETALARADWLSGNAVLTPGGVLARHGRLAEFAMIPGAPGRSVVDSQSRSIEPMLFRPIVRMHALRPGLPLPRFDPLAKIVPRLDNWTAAKLQGEMANALDVIDSFDCSNVVIHGDLHAGQFVIDETGSAWLLDLDDLSEGDPAADIGNFAAHLATRDESGRKNPNAFMSAWLHVVLLAYGQAGGRVSPALAAAYGQLALIRRALKFRERGKSDLLAALCGRRAD
ncbi:MAG: phosphotransferase [Rhizobiaceae bacterium]